MIDELLKYSFANIQSPNIILFVILIILYIFYNKKLKNYIYLK